MLANLFILTIMVVLGATSWWWIKRNERRTNKAYDASQAEWRAMEEKEDSRNRLAKTRAARMPLSERIRGMSFDNKHADRQMHAELELDIDFDDESYPEPSNDPWAHEKGFTR